MIGIVIPACNEEDSLEACIQAIRNAISEVEDRYNKIKVLVVLDDCQDQTLEIVKHLNVDYLECDARCVGLARDLGIRHLIDQGVTWIACTDADSRVDQKWLKQQLNAQPVDAICGVVEVDHWNELSQQTQEIYVSQYQDKMGHRHIHGANLSFSAEAYLKSGGFEAIACHEDVHLVERMQSLNMKIAWTNLVRVKTSSRLVARAPEGFAKFLLDIELNNTFAK